MRSSRSVLAPRRKHPTAPGPRTTASPRNSALSEQRWASVAGAARVSRRSRGCSALLARSASLPALCGAANTSCACMRVLCALPGGAVRNFCSSHCSQLRPCPAVKGGRHMARQLW